MTKKQKINYDNWLSSYRVSLIRHFSKRCRERLDWDVTEADVTALNKYFQGMAVDNYRIYVDKQKTDSLEVKSTNSRRWYYLIFESAYVYKEFWLCFNKQVKCVTTAYHRDRPPTITKLVVPVDEEFELGFRMIESEV